jgi:hypothetical protein
MVKTNREKFLDKHNLPSDDGLSLPQIAKLSGMPLGALKKVEARGFGAYSSSPESVRMKGTFKKGVDAPMSQKLSAPQWARARVYAFVMKTPKVFYGADKDIAEEYKLI